MPAFGNTTADTGGRWVIPAGELGSRVQATWIRSLTDDLQRTLLVSDVVQPAGEAPRLKGRVLAPWPVPGNPEDRLQEIDLEIECDNRNRFFITAASGELSANGRTMAVRGSWMAGDEDVLSLVTADASRALSLLSRSDRWLELDLPVVIRDGAGLLAQGTRTSLAVAPLRANPPSALWTWSCELPDLSIGQIPSPFKSVTLQYKVRATGINRGDDEAPYCRQALAFDGTLALDQDYRFVGSVSPAGLARFEITPRDPAAAFPGPAAFLKAIGLDAASHDVDEAIGKVPILKSLRVLSAGFDIDLPAKALRGLEIKGMFAVAGCDFDFSLSWPSPTFSVQLSSATPIELGQIAASLLPDAAGLPSALKINYLSFTVGAAPFSVSSAIGFQDIWEFRAGSIPFKFEALQLESRFGSGPAAATITTRWRIADVDLELRAQRITRGQRSGWRFSSAAAEEHPISLDKLVAAVAKMLDFAPPDHFPAIDISALEMSFDTIDKAFTLHALVTLAKPLGSFKTSAVSMDLSIGPSVDDPDRRDVHLTLAGNLEIAGTSLHFDADLSNSDWKLKAGWKDGEGNAPGLIELVKAVAPEFDTSTVPEHLHAALTPAEITFTFESKGPRFGLTGRTKAGQQLVVQVCRTSAGWGVVFALGYARASDVPDFGTLVEGVTIRNCWLLISALPATKHDELTFDGTGIPVKLSELGKGIALAAELDIDQQQSEAFKNLKRVAPGANTFRLLGAIMSKDGVTNALLDLEYAGVLLIADGKGGYLEIKDVGLKIEAGGKGFSLDAHGSISVPLDSHVLVASVKLALSQSAIELSGSLADASGSGFPLFGLKDVRLKEAALLVGIGFTPPSLRLGIAGAIFFRPGQQVPERIAVKFSVSGPVVKPDYFLLDITHIDLVDLIKALAAAKDNSGYFPQRLLGAEAFSFHWSAMNDTLPDGRPIAAGVGFHGLLNIGDWRAFIMFEASGQSFSARGEMDPVESEGFRLHGTGNGYRMKGYTENNVWRPVSNAQAAELPSSVQVTEQLVIRPNGPTIIVNSDHQPYLAANFEIKLLDLIEIKTNILINDDGMEFDLHNEVTGVFYQDFHAHFRKNREFFTAGRFFAGLNIEIPIPIPFAKPVVVRLGIEGRQEIMSGSRFSLDFYYGYDILGLKFSGFELNIPHAPRDFGDVLKMVGDNFVKNVLDGIFGQLVKAILGLKGAASELPLTGSMTDDNLTWTAMLHEPLPMAERVPPRVLRAGAGSLPAITGLDELLDTILLESGAELGRLRMISKEITTINRDKMKRATRTVDARIAGLETQLERRADTKKEVRARLKKLWDANEPTWQAKLRTLYADAAKRDMAAKDFSAKADRIADGHFRTIMRQAAGSRLVKTYDAKTLRYYFDLLRLDKESRFRSAYIVEKARGDAQRIVKQASLRSAPLKIVTVDLKPVQP